MDRLANPPVITTAHANWLLASLVLFVGIMVRWGPQCSSQQQGARGGGRARAGVGVVTPAVVAALNSRKADLGLAAEALAVAVIIVLMVVKPF